MIRTLSLFLSAALVVAASCNKPLEKAVTTVVTSDTTFNLVNRDSLDLYVTLYRSGDDRRNGMNAQASVLSPAGGVGKIPLSQLDTQMSSSYFYDVHASDYKRSNWGYYYDQSFPIFYTGHNFFLTNIQMTSAAYYFIHGGDASVTWKAVDKLSWGDVSVWATSTANERYLVVTLNKNETGTLQHKQSGSLTTLDITDIQASQQTNYCSMGLIVNGFSSYTVYSTTTVPSGSGILRQSRDTITLYDNSYYWVLARQ